MNKAPITFLLLFLSFNVVGYTQTKPVIKKIYAFYTEHLPGNIAIDPRDPERKESTPKADTVITVYIETSSKFIQWDTAWMNKKSYAIVTQQVSQQNNIDAGFTNQGHKASIIKIAKNNFIWQLYLQPVQKNIAAPQKTGNDEILIRGKYKGKNLYKKAAAPVQLEAIPSV